MTRKIRFYHEVEIHHEKIVEVTELKGSVLSSVPLVVRRVNRQTRTGGQSRSPYHAAGPRNTTSGRSAAGADDPAA